MRKRTIAPSGADAVPGADWLDLENIATAEISSEDPDHPVEGALLPGDERGWQAAGPGEQILRLRFDQPQRLRRIWLQFEDPDHERAQEFVLRWSPDGLGFHEILRQQWYFSPGGSTVEVEDNAVDLTAVAVLELGITPDRSGGEARARLTALRVGA